PRRGCTAMINRLIDLSARHRIAVVALALAGAAAGWRSLRQVPLDAVPDLSDTQVIVYSTWDRSPDIIEDQVTYPIVASLRGTRHFGLRRVVRIRGVRRRRRHVLGAVPHARVPVARPVAASAGCPDRAWP